MAGILLLFFSHIPCGKPIWVNLKSAPLKTSFKKRWICSNRLLSKVSAALWGILSCSQFSLQEVTGSLGAPLGLRCLFKPMAPSSCVLCLCECVCRWRDKLLQLAGREATMRPADLRIIQHQQITFKRPLSLLCLIPAPSSPPLPPPPSLSLFFLSLSPSC